MALLDKFFGSTKTLTDLNPQEVRREEILIEKQRDRLFKKVEQITTQKQKLFQQGAQQKAPELRKALAMQFEMKNQEQLMVARELNLRNKELMTVGRLRMLKENQAAGKAGGRLNLTDKDVARMTQWIENDQVSGDMYRERLDTILELGTQADKDALASSGIGAAGQEVLSMWEEMDRGTVKQDEAFDKADQAVRKRTAAAEDM